MVWNILLFHYILAVCIAHGSSTASEVTLPTHFTKGFADEKQIRYAVNTKPRRYFVTRDQSLEHSLSGSHQTKLSAVENHKEHIEEKVRGKGSFRFPRMRKSKRRLKQEANPRLNQEDANEQNNRPEWFALSSSEPTSPEDENQEDSEVASPSPSGQLLKNRGLRTVSSMSLDAPADVETHLREISEVESKAHSTDSPTAQISRSVKDLPMKVVRTENPTFAVAPELPLSSVTVTLPLEFLSQTTELTAENKPSLLNTQQPGKNTSGIEALQPDHTMTVTSDGILNNEEDTVIPVSPDESEVSQLSTISTNVQPDVLNGSGNYRLLKYYKDLLSSEKNLKILQHSVKSVLKGNAANQFEAVDVNSSIRKHNIKNHSLPEKNIGISHEPTTSYPFYTNTDDLNVTTLTVPPYTRTLPSSDHPDSSGGNNSLGSATNKPFRSALKNESGITTDYYPSTYTSNVVSTISLPLITSSDYSTNLIKIKSAASIDPPIIGRSVTHGKEKSVSSNSVKLTTPDTFSKDSNSDSGNGGGQTDIVGSEKYPQSTTVHAVGVADFQTIPSPTFEALMKFLKNFKSYLYTVEPVRQPATESFNMGGVWAVLRNNASSDESVIEKTNSLEHLATELSTSERLKGQETVSLSSGNSLVMKSVDETKEGAERGTSGGTVITKLPNKIGEAVATTDLLLGEKNSDKASSSSDLKSDKEILFPRSSDDQSSHDKTWYDSQNNSDSLLRYAELVKVYNRLRGQDEAVNHINSGNVTYPEPSPVSRYTTEGSRYENQSNSHQLFRFAEFLRSKHNETDDEAERSEGNRPLGRSAHQFPSSSPSNPFIQSRNNSFEKQRKADKFFKFANFLRKNQCISGKCNSSNSQVREFNNESVIQDSRPEPRSAAAQSNPKLSFVENQNNTEDFHRFAAFLRASIPDVSEGETQDSVLSRSKNISHQEPVANTSYSRYKFIHFLANRGKQKMDSTFKGNRAVSPRLASSDGSAVTEPTEKQQTLLLSRERVAVIEVPNSTLTSVPENVQNSTSVVLSVDVNTLTPSSNSTPPALNTASSERVASLSTDNLHLHLSLSHESTASLETTSAVSTVRKSLLLTNMNTHAFTVITENATEVTRPASNATLPFVNESSSIHQTNVSTDTEHFNITSSAPHLFPASEPSETASNILPASVPLKDNVTHSSFTPVDNSVTLSVVSFGNSSDSSVLSSTVSAFDLTNLTDNATSSDTTAATSTLPIFIANTEINNVETTSHTSESALAWTDHSTKDTDSSAFTTDFSTLITEVVTNSEDLFTSEVLNSTPVDDNIADATQTADRVAGPSVEKTYLHDHTSLAVTAGIACFALLIIFIGIAVARKAARERKKSKYLVPPQYFYE